MIAINFSEDYTNRSANSRCAFEKNSAGSQPLPEGKIRNYSDKRRPFENIISRPYTASDTRALVFVIRLLST